MAFRKTGKDPELGAIFMSNGATKDMCFKAKTFGLPYGKKSFVERVKAGMFLFLFEHETRKLYGVFQACSNGAMDFSSEAFSASGNKYPAQVQFKVLWHCKPLSEHEFRPAIKDNYFASKKFHFGLSRNQVKELLQLFKPRRLRDELLQEKMMLHSHPSLVRSCNIVDAGVMGSLFRIHNVNGLDSDRSLESLLQVPVIGNEVAVNDLRMSSATNEAIISNLRSPHPAYCNNAVNGGPSSYNPAYFENISLLSKPDDPSKTISDPLSSEHFQIGSGIQAFGTKHQEDVLPHFSVCGVSHELETTFPSVDTKDISNPVEIKQDSEVCKERKSVFSRLKPALDAADESKLKDPPKGIDQMVNEVMESLKGHYHQLVRESNSPPTKQVDDSDNKSKIKLKKRQCLLSRIAKFEPVASRERVSDVSTANKVYEDQSEKKVIGEVPHIQFKRRSEVQKTRSSAESGLGKTSSPILAEKQCKRRKLVRPSFILKKLSNCDGLLDNIAVNLSPPCNKDVPPPRDNKSDLPETGKVGSGVLSAAIIGGECSDGLSGSSNLTDGSADIGMGTGLENHEGQSLSDPRAYDTQELSNLCNLRSAVLADNSLAGVKSSEESTLVREKESVRLSLTLSGNYEKDANAERDNVKDKLGWSLKDLNLPVDLGSGSCSTQLSLQRKVDEIEGTCLMFNEDHRKHGKAACSNMNDADFRADCFSVAEVCENGSGKSVELGFPNDLDMNTTYLLPVNNEDMEGSVSGQATEVQYFEFLT